MGKNKEVKKWLVFGKRGIVLPVLLVLVLVVVVAAPAVVLVLFSRVG